jgi:hypothetical protein
LSSSCVDTQATLGTQDEDNPDTQATLGTQDEDNPDTQATLGTQDEDNPDTQATLAILDFPFISYVYENAMYFATSNMFMLIC